MPAVGRHSTESADSVNSFFHAKPLNLKNIYENPQ
ncbi:hypothetical protein M2153_003569 [Pseudomonas sp. JUb96]|nr:hypothetical protein [Pseudomonas sp. JUb96]